MVLKWNIFLTGTGRHTDIYGYVVTTLLFRESTPELSRFSLYLLWFLSDSGLEVVVSQTKCDLKGRFSALSLSQIKFIPK